MRAGRLYRNWKQVDVDMLVVRIQYTGPEYVKAEVHWILRRNGAPLTNPQQPDKVRIPRKLLRDWVEIR